MNNGNGFGEALLCEGKGGPQAASLPNMAGAAQRGRPKGNLRANPPAPSLSSCSTDAVVSVAWNPAQPDVVATGGCDDAAYLWRVGQDAFEASAGSMGTHELSGHTDTVAALGFNAAGSMLATAGMDGERESLAGGERMVAQLCGWR